MIRKALNKSINIIIVLVLVSAFLVSCSKTEQTSDTGSTSETISEAIADTTAAEISAEATANVTETSATTTDPITQTTSETATAETSAIAAASTSEARLLIIETTDIHGNIIDASSGNEDTFQYRMAYIAHVVNEARASGEYDDVILLDGGDLYQGPPVSDLLYGDSVKAVIDAMDYDAVCLGNHEFDWDVTSYCADSDGTVAAYNLDEYSNDPDIPIVAANLCDEATGERVPFTRDYVILEKAGKRIAVIGYLEDYRDSVKAEKIAPYTIDDSYEKFNELVSEINEKEDPDMTLVLAHCDPGPLAEAMDPTQVDLVIGGHTHEISVGAASNGIPFMQGNSKAQGYASAVAVIDIDGNVEVEDVNYTSIVDDKTILYDTDENLEHLDETVLDISYAAWNLVWEDMSEVLGYIDTPILKDRKNGVCIAGNFITEVMLRAMQEEGAVASFWNYGGVRTSFKIPSGEFTRPITIYDIYSMIPFGNTMLLYDITGAELARHLELALFDSSYGDLVSGLNYTYSVDGDKYTVLSITLDDGTEIDPNDEETIWRICISDYCATCEGSIFEDKDPVLPLADSPIDHELVVQQLREERDAGDGYIEVDSGIRGVEVTE